MAQLSATAAAEAHWAALSSPWAAGTEVWTQAQLLECGPGTGAARGSRRSSRKVMPWACSQPSGLLFKLLLRTLCSLSSLRNDCHLIISPQNHIPFVSVSLFHFSLFIFPLFISVIVRMWCGCNPPKCS